MVDFVKIQDFLNDILIADEKVIDIIDRSGFTPEQLKMVNILIVSALRAYDAESSK